MYCGASPVATPPFNPTKDGSASYWPPGARPEHVAPSTTSRSPWPTWDALIAWGEHLTAIGIDHEDIVPDIVGGHPLDLFDPDGNNIELVYEA